MSMNFFRSYMSLLAILAYLILPVSLYADESASNDIKAGQRIFNFGLGDKVPPCLKCHGANGLGLGAVDIATPRIASQVYTYLLKQLTDFATNRRTDDIMHQMNGIAKALGKQQRKDVSAYLHSIKWSYSSKDLTQFGKNGVQIGDPVRGERIFKTGIAGKGVAACQVCHGYDGQGAGSLYPALSGQNYLYLTHELAAFRRAAQGASAHARANDFMGQMRAVAARLSDQDINDVSAFLTAAKPPPAPDNPHDPGSEVSR